MECNGVSWKTTKESIDYMEELEYNEIFMWHNSSEYINNETEFYGRLTVEQQYRMFGWDMR